MEAKPSRKKRYAEFLARNGWKSGRHEIPVLDAVFSMNGTFSAEDIMSNVGEKASRPTIYRTLNRLAEAGLILPVTFNQQPAYVVTSAD